MPMVWYIPPLSPVLDAVTEAGADADDPDNVFHAITDLHIPMEYLASLYGRGYRGSSGCADEAGGSPLFHLGVFKAIGGHMHGLLVPASWTAAIGIPEGTYHVVSVTAGIIAGTMVVAGLVLLLPRRFANPRVRLATTAMDKVLFAVMTVTIALGMAETVGVNLLGGSYNYRDTVSVWFRGIYLLHPDGQLMVHAPLVYQLHVASALVFIALWPFTRLVHVWSAPVAYLRRPYIVYRRRPATRSRVPAVRGHRA